MSNQASAEEITSFLERIKTLVSTGKYDFVPPTRPGDIWEFKKDVDGIQFYVKVKVVQENGEDILKCLGFHEDDFA